LFGVLKHRARIGKELLRYEAMTGLNDEQLTDLVARLHELCGDKFVSAGPPLALGLFRSAWVPQLMGDLVHDCGCWCWSAG
jgi:hypothetical protein